MSDVPRPAGGGIAQSGVEPPFPELPGRCVTVLAELHQGQGQAPDPTCRVVAGDRPLALLGDAGTVAVPQLGGQAVHLGEGEWRQLAANLQDLRPALPGHPELAEPAEGPQERRVATAVQPEADGGSGIREVHVEAVGVRVEAVGYEGNERIESQEKDITIRVEAQADIIRNALIIGGVIALVIGVAVVSIRVSRR